MKAMRLMNADGRSALVEEDIPQPVPGQGEVLVRVYAAGVTHTELGWEPTTHTKAGGVRMALYRDMSFLAWLPLWVRASLTLQSARRSMA